jgi:hypothetical protein
MKRQVRPRHRLSEKERRAVLWSKRCPGALCIVVMMLLALAACAGERVPDMPRVSASYPPTGYVHEVHSDPLELYWNCTRPDPGTVRLEGVAANPWSAQPVQLVSFDLVGVDASGRTASSSSVDVQGLAILNTNQSAPFRIDLHTAGAEVRFDLYYQYLYREGGEPGGQFFQRAAWNGAIPSQNQQFLLALTKLNVVRDACSPTQHLVR